MNVCACVRGLCVVRGRYCSKMDIVQLQDLVRGCQLIPVCGTHAQIDVDAEKPLVIGRGPSTKVTDKKCSRQQVELRADYAKEELHIKQLGSNPSRVATKVLQKGDTYILGPMGWLELLEGQYRYHVHFGAKVPDIKSAAIDVESDHLNHPPPELEDEPPGKKLKLSPTRMHSGQVQRILHSFADTDSSEQGGGSPSRTWSEVNTLLVFQYGEPTNTSKIAATDVDNTVIETSSGRKFATGPTDWKLMSGVVRKLKSYCDKGYKLVLLSNQLGINKGKPTKEEFKQKIEAIALKLEIPFLLMAASAKDKFRKPCTGMWDHLLKFHNGDIEVDLVSSFYVGDAAGRDVNWLPGKKKDFSCTDRKFAANLGIPFFTPEELFLDFPQCKKYNWGFDPRNLPHPTHEVTTSSAPEVVIFVGYPASGKTTFFREHLEPKGYCHVNRDTLGSWQKCVAKCTELLKTGKRVAVDNTNPDRESRMRYIEVAKKFGVPARCFRFLTSLEHCKHNNRFRELTATAKDKRGKVNDMVFNMFKSKFLEPTLEEGLTAIVKIEFTPSFTDKSLETLYHQFLE